MARWGFRDSFLENSDQFEAAQHIANHESPTTINPATFFPTSSAMARRTRRRSGQSEELVPASKGADRCARRSPEQQSAAADQERLRHWAHRPWVAQPSISSGILARSLLVDNLREFARRRQAVSGENLFGISTTPTLKSFRLRRHRHFPPQNQHYPQPFSARTQSPSTVLS
jgi:hypothetical protein